MIPQLTPAEVARFHAQVARGAGCWPWQGETNSNGYGRFVVYRGNRRTRVLAHRLAFTLANGREPVGILRHRCDNPPCCNPADLVEGTQADNIADACERGRANIAGLTAYREIRNAAAANRTARGVKRCPRCRSEKPLSDFHLNRHGVAGRANYCKPCTSSYQRGHKAGPNNPGGEAA